jgi:putative protein-disulfide isomerase
MVMEALPILRYFADPMCSWCWGFTDTFVQLRERFDEDFRFALVMGGLRPYTKEPVSEKFREDILHHWRDVQQMTGQDFSFENAMPDGFIYDTEPPARAVLTVGRLNPENTFAYFRSVQHGFYVDHQDVTNTETLSGLAAKFDVNKDAFIELFDTKEMKAMTQKHYLQTREHGVHGFPTLEVETPDQRIIFANGYRPYQELEEIISEWLAE